MMTKVLNSTYFFVVLFWLVVAAAGECQLPQPSYLFDVWTVVLVFRNGHFMSKIADGFNFGKIVFLSELGVSVAVQKI